MRAFSRIFRKMHTFSSDLHKMSTFYANQMHFMQIRWKCTHFHLICIKCEHFHVKMCTFLWKWTENAKTKFSEIGLASSKVFLFTKDQSWVCDHFVIKSHYFGHFDNFWTRLQWKCRETKVGLFPSKLTRF